MEPEATLNCVQLDRCVIMDAEVH